MEKQTVSVKFKELKHGYIDGKSESIYNRENFRNAFYDLGEVLDKLKNMSYPTSILIGRKGVGKSAYGAKLTMLKDVNAFDIDLGELPYNMFTKISDTKNSAVGTQRYMHSWYLLLILSVIKKLKVGDVRDKRKLNELKKIYSELGLPVDRESNSIITDIAIASKKEFKVKLSALEFSIGDNDGSNLVKVSNLTELTNYAVDLFINLGVKKDILPVIDGVDDILRTKKQKMDILSGLVRAVHVLNQKNIVHNNHVKFILVIRDDIIKSIADPDMNKIIHDSGHKLDWYGGGNKDLVILVNKRFMLTPELNIEEPRSLELWQQFFPKIINKKDSWSYFLEHTMYRPRDIVQFLNQFIESYPEEREVSIIDFKNELRKFSKDYFFEEMKNELLGFLNDEIIDSLFQVLQKIGSENFNFNKFADFYESMFPDYSRENIKSILNTLFNLGYVGMVRRVSRGKSKKTYINFKHRDPRLVIDYANNFVIHKGLHSALNV